MHLQVLGYTVAGTVITADHILVIFIVHFVERLY